MGNALKVAIVIGCLVTSAILLYTHFTTEAPGSHEGARYFFYICSDAQCATEYAVAPHEAPVGRERWQCPKCGNDAGDAARCPTCGRYHLLVGRGRYLPTCPHCQTEMPPLVEQLQDAERELGGR